MDIRNNLKPLLYLQKQKRNSTKKIYATMPKLYFTPLVDTCNTIEAIKDLMIADEIKEVKATEAQRMTGSGFFYCRKFGGVSEVGICGKECKAYKPRNGKSGRCKHSGHVYEETDKVITIKI